MVDSIPILVVMVDVKKRVPGEESLKWALG